LAYLLVPLEASQTRATIWVGAVGEEPAALSVAFGGTRSIQVDGPWTEFATWNTVRIRAQRVAVDGLPPGATTPVVLRDGGAVVATASVTTLPDVIPPLGSRPLTWLLGSCFGRLSDAAGAAGATAAMLPAQYRPDATILCGDQVYLDAPFGRFLTQVLLGEELRAALLETYLGTWTQDTPGAGFARILAGGATWFSADDHEMWNNAPFRSPAVLNSWFGRTRDELRSVATTLYDLFQTPARSSQWRVGRLSALTLDTRMDRTPDRRRLMRDDRVDELEAWIDGLAGPGVLVVGQPMLTEGAGRRGYMRDWRLPDFDQYGAIVRAIQRSRRDIVVLTGDAHFGRVASCTLPTGARMIEVIASPFALVDARLGYNWKVPAGRFPAHPIPGSTGCTVEVERDYREARDHFATVGFSDVGNRVRMEVRAWPIRPPGWAPTPGSAYSTDLS
jgi:hypothetical protein